MKKLLLSLGIVSLFCGGCVPNYGDTTLYQTSGRQKPIVAVLPVIDTTTTNTLSWDLSEELTDELRKRVYDSKKIYLLRDGGNQEMAKLLSTPNPKAIPLAAASDLGAAQFAVVAEIFEQEEEGFGIMPMGLRGDAGSVLSVALRVRVLDVRDETPKVILQEVIDTDYVISRAYMNCDYDRFRWGSDAFVNTPMGIAHNRLIRTLVSRIEAYIEAAQ